jgi:hypothetical protein
VRQNLYLLKQSRSNENDNKRTLSLANHIESSQQDNLAEIPENYSVLSGNTDPTQNIRDVNPRE